MACFAQPGVSAILRKAARHASTQVGAPWDCPRVGAHTRCVLAPVFCPQGMARRVTSDTNLGQEFIHKCFTASPRRWHSDAESLNVLALREENLVLEDDDPCARSGAWKEVPQPRMRRARAHAHSLVSIPPLMEAAPKADRDARASGWSPARPGMAGRGEGDLSLGPWSRASRCLSAQGSAPGGGGAEGFAGLL